MDRRNWLARAAAGVAALATCQAARAAVQDETWSDPRRERALPLRVRWPDGDGPCALVLHSHGLGGNRDGGDAWGQAWRRAGIAVLHLQHPGSDTDVLYQGPAALRAAASVEQLRARVADMQFALDEVTRRAHRRERGWSRVRLDAIGASGHSFGAVTVQALAGQRYPIATPRSADPRIKAFVAFSPSLGPGPAPSEAFAAVTRPFLAVTGSLDRDALGRGLSGADRARVYDALPPGRRALLWLAGADHLSFAGHAEKPLRARFGPLQRESITIEREATHHALIAAVTTAWWRAELAGDAEARAALRTPPGLGEDDRWRQD